MEADGKNGVGGDDNDDDDEEDGGDFSFPLSSCLWQKLTMMGKERRLLQCMRRGGEQQLFTFLQSGTHAPQQ